jgi:hypothetical protein
MGTSGALERALAALAEDRAPAALRARVALITAAPRAPRWPAGGLAAAVCAAAAVAAAFAISGGGAVPSVAEAVALAARPGMAPVHEPLGHGVTHLRVSGAGISFPYWGERFGWEAVGLRRDRLDGRTLSTVFYVRGGRRLAYTIASGPPLPGDAGARPESTYLQSRTVLTWRRGGHTCVLSGASVSSAELVALASWRAD